MNKPLYYSIKLETDLRLKAAKFFGVVDTRSGYRYLLDLAVLSGSGRSVVAARIRRSKMIPVEPISLSIGIAALFTTCIQCFEYFKAATTSRRDFDILLLTLELEQERLLIWGEVIGIGSKDWSEELTFKGDSKRQDLARRCLDTIKSLLEDAEGLKSTYGVQSAAATARPASRYSITSNALKRFRVRLARSPNKLGVLDQTRWAIHDAAKFQKLIRHLREMIDGLMRDASGPQDTHDEKIQDDIVSMTGDISSLRLFSEVCSDIYPEWSATAESAIDATELGTTDGNLVNQRLEQYQADDNEGALGDARHTRQLPTCFGDDKGII